MSEVSMIMAKLLSCTHHRLILNSVMFIIIAASIILQQSNYYIAILSEMAKHIAAEYLSNTISQSKLLGLLDSCYSIATKCSSLNSVLGRGTSIRLRCSLAFCGLSVSVCSNILWLKVIFSFLYLFCVQYNLISCTEYILPDVHMLFFIIYLFICLFIYFSIY